MLRRIPILALISILLLTIINLMPLSAQTGYPLPDKLQTITVDNVSQITQLAAIESAHLGFPTWSPDGSLLAVGSSAGVKIYQAADLTTPPITIAGGLDVVFHPSGEKLLSNGILWDITTQQALFEIGRSDQQQFSPTGDFLLTAFTRDSLTAFTLWNTTNGQQINTFDIETDLFFQQAVFSIDERQYALSFASGIPCEGRSLVHVRTTQAGQIILEAKVEYENLYSVAFSTNGDYLFANNAGECTLGPYEKLIVWSLANGQRITEVRDFYYFVLISPDSSVLILKNYVHLRRIELDSLENTLLTGESLTPSPGYDMSFSPDSRYLAASVEKSLGDISEYAIAIWDQQSPETSTEPILLQHDTQISDFAFNPDSSSIAVNSGEQIHIWDIESRSKRLTLQSHGSPAFTSSGEHLLVTIDGQTGRTIQIWDTITGNLLNQTFLPRNIIHTLSPTKLQTAYRLHGQIHVIDFISATETLLPGLDGYLGEMRYLDETNGLVAFQGENLHITNLYTGTQIIELSGGSQGLTISPDGTKLFLEDALPFSPAVMLTTIHRLDDLAVPPFILEDALLWNRLCVSPDSNLLYASNTDYSTFSNNNYIYNSNNGDLLSAWQDELQLRFDACTFSPNGNYLITGLRKPAASTESIIKVWDVEALLAQNTTEPLVQLTLKVYDVGQIFAITFSSDGTYMAIAIDDALVDDGIAHGSRISIINLPDLIQRGGTLHETQAHAISLQGAYSPQFSPNISYMVTKDSSLYWSTNPDTIILWDIFSGDKLITLDNYKGGVFSPDGSLLVAFTADNFAVWQVDALASSETTPLLTLNTTANTREIAFSSDGTRLYQRTDYGVTIWGISP